MILFRIASILSALALLWFSNAARATEYPPISVPMELKQISERVYYVQGAAGIATSNEGFISNAGFVVTGEGVVVFDSLGTPSLGAELLKLIRSVTDQPVVMVVVSHYHADHIYGLQPLKEAGAKILAPAGALEYYGSPYAQERLAERRISLYPWVNENSRLVPPDELVAASRELQLGEVTLRLNFLGAAHSDGDLSMLVLPDGVLFSGDIIFEGRLPFVGDADTRRWAEALESMQTVGIKALIPGHGPAASAPNQALAETRDYILYLREVMGAAVEEMAEFAGAYEAADWSRYEQLPAFEETNRRNAYQVYLGMERESM
jgi:glyoxylase-like metal-dependent hydrolase (beta-lactamase superfamily II)